MNRPARLLSALTLTLAAALAGCGGPEDGVVLDADESFSDLPPAEREAAMKDSSAAARAGGGPGSAAFGGTSGGPGGSASGGPGGSASPR
ncbi:hypothetical protein [Alienimonas sp. DA493]|uniref:hypothetical protein n=1 Tax=Alienimonas sp. DA493 TaxID=3373605 RepID=UPI0037550E58